tara:strand:- start:2041 stop:2538 length:498 start_codon:yes stop_codon:yes gene_type:complete
MAMDEYLVAIKKLSAEDGGGFLAYIPDLPGCISDGETRAEAIEHLSDAFDEWIECNKDEKRKVPEPGRSQRLFLKRQKARDELIEKQEELIEALNDLNSQIMTELQSKDELIEDQTARIRVLEKSVEVIQRADKRASIRLESQGHWSLAGGTADIVTFPKRRETA